MRQVGHAELLVLLRYQLSRVQPATRARFASRDRDAARVAEQMMAEALVKGLSQLEILSSGVLAAGSDLFSSSAYGGGAGSAPKMADEA